jgi:hypothetical protein
VGEKRETILGGIDWANFTLVGQAQQKVGRGNVNKNGQKSSFSSTSPSNGHI